MNTFIPKNIERKWFEIDASAGSVGRIASRISHFLRGKHKRQFSPHMDMGDFVVAVNADKLKFTGRKIAQKVYFRHSKFLGGLKKTPLSVLIQKNPHEVLAKAVFNMLDDIKFRKKLMSRLKIISGTNHTFKIDKKI